MLAEKTHELLKDRIQKIKTDFQDLYLVGPIRMPVNLDGETVTFKWYVWLSGDQLPKNSEDLLAALPEMNLEEHQQSSVLVYGDFAESEEAVIRMHSICHTGDIFGSKRCDCGFQLKESMRLVKESGNGAVFYLANHEGRGIGLFSKALTYLLQEQGHDTVEANLRLGLPEDARSYKEAVAVLKTLRSKRVSLLTNNPKKLMALRLAGLKQVKHVNLWGDISSFNRRYLQTKIKKTGHLIEENRQEELFKVEDLLSDTTIPTADLPVKQII